MFDYKLINFLKTQSKIYKHQQSRIDLQSVVYDLDLISSETVADYVSSVPWVSAIPVEFPIMRSFQVVGSSDFVGVGIDGSQIYPDQNSPFQWGYVQAVSYALSKKSQFRSQFINLSSYMLSPGQGQLFGGYDEEKAFIDYNRMLLEIKLSRFLQKKVSKGMILFDGPVIPWIGKSKADSQIQMAKFSRQLSQIDPERFCGIVSDPRSHHLSDLAVYYLNQIGLRLFRDIDFLKFVLPEFSRSVRFRYVSWKGQFLEKETSPREFFYIRMRNGHFIRLEYLASNESEILDVFHKTLLQESQGLDYPYVLAMAHQHATVPLDVSRQMHAIVRSELGLFNTKSRKEILK